MDCYFTLCHNIYGYSLLFYKVYLERENAGSWNSRLERVQIWETYSAQLQKSKKFTEYYIGIYKNYWAKNYHGAHRVATSLGGTPYPWVRPLPRGPPGRPPVPSFAI